MYKNIDPVSSDSQFSQLAKVCSRVRSLGLTLCVSSRADRSVCVSAKWCVYNSRFEEPVLDSTAEVHPGSVKQFLVISVKMQDKNAGKNYMTAPSPRQTFLWKACGGLGYSGNRALHHHSCLLSTLQADLYSVAWQAYVYSNNCAVKLY